ncbi:MAG: phosphodiester glycosidase family protein [Candidatus Margulisiibacteriota bacterium]
MRKILATILLFSLLAGSAFATTLYRIRFGHYPEKIRAVFDFDGGFTYESDEAKDKIVLRLKKTRASSEIQNYVELNDLIVRYLEVEKEGEDLKVTIPLSEPVEYNVFYLNDPPRLVIDFSREYLNIVSGGTLADGVEFLKVNKGMAAGHINAGVLRVDLARASVKPALAKKQKPNILESFMDLITPWAQKKTSGRFFLGKVSQIVEENNGLAGINGTYFANSGRPLGALMIDRELVSFSIYDRTALFFDQQDKPYIDNIFISSHFKTKNGTRYKITGINQSREAKDTIMFTPTWGERTGTNSSGIEIVVSKSKIIEVNVSNSKIPEDGYVLSITGPGVEVLAEQVKAGDKIDTRIQIIPYSAAPEKIIHLISGGPRLLKLGRIYVSKHEEKFKTDIAKGRAARTAVGITKQGELLLVTVDGPPRGSRKSKEPSKDSIGVTLEELSSLMLSLGAYEAMNLDGGSSSTMVIDQQVVNKPASGYQRSVSNAIVVLPKR